MSLLKDITNLGNQLPQKEIIYFEKCIQERRFDDALELVDSIITIVDLATEFTNSNRNYLNLDRETLLLLQGYLSKYVDQLSIEEYCSHDNY